MNRIIKRLLFAVLVAFPILAIVLRRFPPKVLPIAESEFKAEQVTPYLTVDNMESAETYSLAQQSTNVRFQKKNLPGRDMTIFDYDRNLPQLDKTWPYPPDQVKALEYGADSRITIVVVDSKTNAIVNAEVEVIPTFHDRPLSAKLRYSDENGKVLIGDSKASCYVVNIRKEGYYPTYTSLSLHVPGLDCVKDGKWQPWNPIIAITLKEIRNPGELIHKTVNTLIPIGKECFFDFVNASFLPPCGNGVITNMSFLVKGFKKKIVGLPRWKSPWKIEKRSRFSFPEREGMIRRSIDAWSTYRYVYEAPEQGYVNEIVEVYESNGETGEKKDTGLTSGEYYIFRFQHELGEQTIGHYYGMIIHPISIRLTETSNVAKVSFDYYISKSVDDRNLETIQWLR